MRLRPRRRNLVVWSSTAIARLARTARVRWEPVSLLAGALITVAGFAIPAIGWAFLLGLLVLIGTLLRGIDGQRRQRGPMRRMGPTL
jgi:hypothetical protein